MAAQGLKQRLQDDMKTALKAKDSARLAVIRLILSAIKQREIDDQITLDDAQVLAVVDKAAKQRRESIEQYQQAQRQDLVDKESFELSVIQDYLPEPLDEAALQKLVEQTIADTGAQSMKDMGKVMAALKPQVQGRADMSQLSNQIKAVLNNL